jgi:hypothetical protein
VDVFSASSEIGSGGVCCHLFSTCGGWKDKCIKIECQLFFMKISLKMVYSALKAGLQIVMPY